MGVKGLKQHIYSHIPHLYKPIIRGPDSEPANVVIDAYSLIWAKFFETDFIKSNYVHYELTLDAFFISLERFNLRPFIVFDGPRSTERNLKVTLCRSESTIPIVETYWRASDQLRGNSSFQKETSLCCIPPFVSETLARVARKRGIELIFVGDDEADAVVSLIAEKENAYILSTDTDFMIYPNGRGLIDLNTLTWKMPPSEDDNGPTESSVIDDDWNTIGRQKKRHPSQYPLHDMFSMSTHLEATLYDGGLADALKIPADLLDLFAVLVGTDQLDFDELYRTAYYRAPFARRVSERITNVSRIISEVSQMDDLQELVEYTTTKLSEIYQTNRSIEEIISLVIGAMGHYNVNREAKKAYKPFQETKGKASDMYLQSLDELYTSGGIKEGFVEALTRGIHRLPILFDDPDQKTSHDYFLDLRLTCYALAIDVFPESFRLECKDYNGDYLPKSLLDIQENDAIESKNVLLLEYSRKGNHLGPRLITRESLPDLSEKITIFKENNSIGIDKLDLVQRKQLFYDILASKHIAPTSNKEGDLDSDIPLTPFIAILRYAVLRSEVNPTWTDHERKAAIAMAATVNDLNLYNSMNVTTVNVAPPKPTLQRMSELSAAFHAAKLLASVLLLPFGFFEPSDYYDGTLFDRFLNDKKFSADQYMESCPEEKVRQMYDIAVQALTPDMPRDPTPPLSNREKKMLKKRSKKETSSAGDETSSTQNTPKNQFDILMG